MIGHTKDTGVTGNKIERVLSCMGSQEKFFWCGKIGAGLAAKISNNYLSCSIVVGIAEAMAIGIRSGIEPALLHDVIHNSSGRSWMLDHCQPVPGILPNVPSSNNYKLGFKTQMMVKDVSLGVEAAEAVGIEPSIARAALAVYREAAKNPLCIVSRCQAMSMQHSSTNGKHAHNMSRIEMDLRSIYTSQAPSSAIRSIKGHFFPMHRAQKHSSRVSFS